MTEEEIRAAKLIQIAMRTRRPLAAYPKGEDLKEIFLDLITTTAVWCGNIPEEDAVENFRNCLRWVRGEAVAEEPKPPSDLN
jgi:hypothetical protein